MGGVTQSHDEGSEACLNRQIFNNSVKSKAMVVLIKGPRKLTHKDLRRQNLDILNYKDLRNISRNMHKVLSSKLLLPPTDIEETH